MVYNVLAAIIACLATETAAQTTLRWNQLCEDTVAMCTKVYLDGPKNNETIWQYYECVSPVHCYRWSEGYYHKLDVLSEIQARKEFYDLESVQWWKNGTALGQFTSTTVIPLLTPTCSSAVELGRCRDAFINSTTFLPAGNPGALCMARGSFSICLEAAVCTCQYPTDHPVLENAYKDIMRNNYDFMNESCEKFNTGYTLKPGITCEQSSSISGDNFRIVQATSNQPFIVELTQNCSSVGPCFTQRDRDFEAAMYNKSLTSYCRDYDVFLKCFEMKACECNMQTDQSMLMVDDFEKHAFTEICSSIAGTQVFIPEIACGGTCSLSDPGIICTQEFEKNIATSQGDENFCRHLVTYAECYEKLVCECGLYQDRNVFTAVSITKYTFEVKTNCSRFPGVSFPSNESGFMCPNDIKVKTQDKVLILNTSKDDFVKEEEKFCPGVTECFVKYDINGSAALNNKNLKAICQAMNEEIRCLEEITCQCGTLNTRFSSILSSKRNSLNLICGQGVIELPPAMNCIDQSVCAAPAPLESCSNILNRQAQQQDDAQRVACENYYNHAQCVKDVTCACGLAKNGSSNTAVEVYKLLNRNAANYDSMGCPSRLNSMQTGLQCKNTDPMDESTSRLNLTWTQSNENNQLVSECPSLKDCFGREESINEEALYIFDYKRVCRNQLNTIKCMEKSYCECGLDKNDTKTLALQEKFVNHNTECSKYAPFGNKKVCGADDVCVKANTEDVCIKWLTNVEDPTAKCIEYTSYLFCVFDVACSCNLVKDGSLASTERVYRNITEAVYRMASYQCPIHSIPTSLFQAGFECFDMTTAEPVQMAMLNISFREAEAVQQWSTTCPDVVTCASLYDKSLSEALNVKNFEAACLSTSAMIQCSSAALRNCNTQSSSQALAFSEILLSKFSGCPADNTTETVNINSNIANEESSNFTNETMSNIANGASSDFTSQAVVGVNSSKLEGVNTKSGNDAGAFVSSWKLMSALVISIILYH